MAEVEDGMVKVCTQELSQNQISVTYITDEQTSARAVRESRALRSREDQDSEDRRCILSPGATAIATHPNGAGQQGREREAMSQSSSNVKREEEEDSKVRLRPRWPEDECPSSNAINEHSYDRQPPKSACCSVWGEDECRRTL